MNIPSPLVNLDVTDIRRDLVNRSNDLHRRAETYNAVLIAHNNLAPDEPAADADLDAHDGLETASMLAWTLAAVLRLVADRHPETAFLAAGIAETGMNAGVDWLDDANDDLDDLDDKPAAV